MCISIPLEYTPEVANKWIFQEYFVRLVTFVIEQRVFFDQNGEMSHWTSFPEVNGSYYLFYITNVMVIIIDLVKITIDMIHVKVVQFL